MVELYCIMIALKRRTKSPRKSTSFISVAYTGFQGGGYISSNWIRYGMNPLRKAGWGEGCHKGVARSPGSWNSIPLKISSLRSEVYFTCTISIDYIRYSWNFIWATGNLWKYNKYTWNFLSVYCINTIIHTFVAETHWPWSYKQLHALTDSHIGLK